jgi:hypothetical protein
MKLFYIFTPVEKKKEAKKKKQFDKIYLIEILLLKEAL